MSFTQKEVINEILKKQTESNDEVAELKRLSSRFAENERTKKAKEIAFSDGLADLRGRFSQFFNQRPQEGQS